METVTPAELPTELAAVVRAGSEAGQDYGPAVAALARLGIVTREWLRLSQISEAYKSSADAVRI